METYVIDEVDHSRSTIKRKHRLANWSALGNIVLMTCFSVAVVLFLRHFSVSELKAFISSHRNLSFLISLVVIILTGLTFIPTIPFTLLTAVLIGPIPATIVTTIAETLTALVHYQVGKQVGDVLNFKQKIAKLPAWFNKIPIQSPIFLMAGRAFPGGPKGMSFICGAYAVPSFLYLWTTVVANLLGAAFIAFGGDQLIKL